MLSFALLHVNFACKKNQNVTTNLINILLQTITVVCTTIVYHHQPESDRKKK